MGVVKDKVFCVIGLSFFDRQRAIEKIKKSILKNKNSILNTTILYSHEITTQKLKEVINNYSFGGEKVVIFKDAQALSEEVRKFLLSQFKRIISFNYIIFEIDRDYPDFVRDRKIIADKFFQYILRYSNLKKIHSFKTENTSLGKFIYALRRNDITLALCILENLFLWSRQNSQLGVQILGVLVKESLRLPNIEEKRRWFKLIWETDRLIKEKGIKSQLALELLITKLLEGRRRKIRIG